MASAAVSSSLSRSASASSSSSHPPPSQRALVKTLRLTPQNPFPHIQRTCAFIRHHLKSYGVIVRLRGPEGQEDYFEVEFFTEKDAKDALNNCHMQHMTIEKAARNISPATGSAYSSSKPPRCDYDKYNTEPSLPLPCNNPYPNEWRVPKRKGNQQQPQQPPKPVQVVLCRPDRVQIEAANPKNPCKKRYWPKFPIYPPSPIQSDDDED